MPPSPQDPVRSALLAPLRRGLRHEEAWHWRRVTMQDANLGLASSRGLLGETMERNEASSLLRRSGLALNSSVWSTSRPSPYTFPALRALPSLSLSDSPHHLEGGL